MARKLSNKEAMDVISDVVLRALQKLHAVGAIDMSTRFAHVTLVEVVSDTSFSYGDATIGDVELVEANVHIVASMLHHASMSIRNEHGLKPAELVAAPTEGEA